VGLTTIIRLLPFVLFSTFAGVLADRYNRKRLMILADVSRGVLMGALALIAAAHASALLVLVVAACSTTFSTVYLPCVNASTPALVGEEDLAAANTITATVFNRGPRDRARDRWTAADLRLAGRGVQRERTHVPRLRRVDAADQNQALGRCTRG
jgi:MFS family permease